MSDWQVPGAPGGSEDGRDERPGGAARPPAQQPSGAWPGQSGQSGAWQGQSGQSGPWQGPSGQPGPWQGPSGQPGQWVGGPGGPSVPPPVGSRPVLPLRPLGLGDVLAGAFTVFRRNARVLLLWSLLLSGVLGLLSTLVSVFGQQALQSRMLSAVDGGATGSDSILAGSFTLWLVLSVALPFLAYLGRGFLVAPVAADTGARVLGRRATFRGLWALLAGRRWSVVAWILLQLAAGVVIGIVFVGVVIGLVAAASGSGSGAGLGAFLLGFFLLGLGFAVVLVWLGTKFAFTVPTIALEGRPVFQAAAQSWRLTRGAFWRTFGIILLVQAVFGVAVSIATIPLTIGAVLLGGTFDPLGQTDAASGAGTGGVIAIVVGSLLGIAVQCVTDVLSASVVTFLAIDRRIRTEALDQRIASHLETGTPTDPFAPSPRVDRPVWPGQGWPGAAPQQPWPGQPGTAPGQPWPGQPGPGAAGGPTAPPQWGGAPGRYPPDGRA
ncbi:glycerophosphoryl diester phosphodiesterase membrane domain-containing protein [Curtobacterium sp. B18]|uniref:glycerophosphoryl diester phosphodiesterase membrane domain-containing protein n=1 Tax=Curtobacterium sp. B18 TaxID=95614 RepID=UPI0011D22544|nr:glycerophosphoryl diester phosphodiesterase membrane domain-containing protein [Curtobacterium sp. B18]